MGAEWKIIYGGISGLFGMIIGAGGGFILTPVLLFIYPHDTLDTITSISLLVTLRMRCPDACARGNGFITNMDCFDGGRLSAAVSLARYLPILRKKGRLT